MIRRYLSVSLFHVLADRIGAKQLNRLHRMIFVVCFSAFSFKPTTRWVERGVRSRFFAQKGGGGRLLLL